jgi:hypothetical protein
LKLVNALLHEEIFTKINKIIKKSLKVLRELKLINFFIRTTILILYYFYYSYLYFIIFIKIGSFFSLVNLNLKTVFLYNLIVFKYYKLFIF